MSAIIPVVAGQEPSKPLMIEASAERAARALYVYSVDNTCRHGLSDCCVVIVVIVWSVSLSVCLYMYFFHSLRFLPLSSQAEDRPHAVASMKLQR